MPNQTPPIEPIPAYTLLPIHHYIAQQPISPDLKAYFYSLWNNYYTQELQKLDSSLRESTYGWMAHLCTVHPIHITSPRTPEDIAYSPLESSLVSVPNLEPSTTVIIPGHTDCAECTRLQSFIRNANAYQSQITILKQAILSALQSHPLPPQIPPVPDLTELEQVLQRILNPQSTPPSQVPNSANPTPLDTFNQSSQSLSEPVTSDSFAQNAATQSTKIANSANPESKSLTTLDSISDPFEFNSEFILNPTDWESTFLSGNST